MHGRAHPAVVRALHGRVGDAAAGGVGGGAEEVLLLQAEPRLHVLCLEHGEAARVAVVGGQGAAAWRVRVAHDEDVRLAAERVSVDGLRFQRDVRGLVEILAGGGAVVRPVRQVLGAFGRHLEGARLAAHAVRPVDPHVFG